MMKRRVKVNGMFSRKDAEFAKKRITLNFAVFASLRETFDTIN